MPCDESWIYCYDPEIKRQSSQWKHAGFPRPKKARHSKSILKLLMIPFFDSTGLIYRHWVPTGQIVNKEYYVEVLRAFRKRFRRKRPAPLQSGQWHFHQDNTLVHNSIVVTDNLTKMGIKIVPQPPYSPDLSPCDFWLFPKLRGCRYETIEEMKDEGHWHAHARGLPWSHPEVVWTVPQVRSSRRRLLRSGLEFHVCTINKRSHTKKVWKLIVCTSKL